MVYKAHTKGLHQPPPLDKTRDILAMDWKVLSDWAERGPWGPELRRTFPFVRCYLRALWEDSEHVETAATWQGGKCRPTCTPACFQLQAHLGASKCMERVVAKQGRLRLNLSSDTALLSLLWPPSWRIKGWEFSVLLPGPQTLAPDPKLVLSTENFLEPHQVPSGLGHTPNLK